MLNLLPAAYVGDINCPSKLTTFYEEDVKGIKLPDVTPVRSQMAAEAWIKLVIWLN